MSGLAVYGGLFLAAFAAATILPAQSEAVLAGLLAAGNHAPVLLVLVAGAGNVLGSVVNWLLGRGIERFSGARWFPDARLNYAQNLLRRRDNGTALVFKGEEKVTRRMTYGELYLRVARLAAAMKAASMRGMG